MGDYRVTLSAGQSTSFDDGTMLDAFDNFPSSSDHTMIFFYLTVENLTQEEKSPLRNDFSVYVDDTATEKRYFASNLLSNGYSSLSNFDTIAPCRKVRGFICVLAPKTWQRAELEFSGATWAITPSDCAAATTESAAQPAPDSPADTTNKHVVGENVSTGSYDVTISRIKRTDYVPAGYGSYSPDEGFDFVIVFVDMKNTASETRRVHGIDYQFYVDDIKTQQTGFMDDVDGYDELADWGEDLAPGRKLSGYLVIQAPKGWQNVEIEFDGETWLFAADSVETS